MTKKEYKKIVGEIKENTFPHTYKARDAKEPHEEEVEAVEFEHIVEILLKYIKKKKKKTKKNKKIAKRIKKLLDRDTPEKPLKSPYAKGSMYRNCPICGEGSLAKGKDKYCNRCGKKLDWRGYKW